MDCIDRELADKALQELEEYYTEEFMKRSNPIHEAAMGGRMFGITRARETIFELPSVDAYEKAIADALDALCSECSIKQNGGKCSKCEQYHAILSLVLEKGNEK